MHAHAISLVPLRLIYAVSFTPLRLVLAHSYTSEFVMLRFVIVHTALYCYSSILDHVAGLALLCFIYE